MSCETIGSDLSAYLDGELDSAAIPGVEAHLETCEVCRRAIDSWKEAGRRLREADCTPDVAPAVRAAVERLRLRARSRRRRRWVAATVAALGLLAPALFFRQALANREVERLVDLEEENRADASFQIDSVCALKLDIAALLFRAQAVGIETHRLDELEGQARDLAREAERIQGRLTEIQGTLEREGLLGDDEDTEVSSEQGVR